MPKPDAIRLLERYKEQVNKNFRKEHMVSFYATELNYSPKSLSNKFHSCMLPSPIEIIHQKLTEEAKIALVESNKQVKLISHELGYKRVSAFSRAFKRATGLSPNKFRLENKQGKKGN